MSRRDTPPPEFEQIAGISEGASNAYLRSLEEDPDLNRQLLQKLTRHNPQLALQLARTARALAEAHTPPHNAYVAGALFLVGSLATQAEANELAAQFTTQPIEAVVSDEVEAMEAAQIREPQET